MILSFELSMPNIASWNGQWSGANNLYAKVVNFGKSRAATTKAKEIHNRGYYHYNFGDGWSAGISVREVSSKEASKIRRASKGFCGYDWMVESIKNTGKIEV
ncbi:MAG: hypothetical protein U9Q97_04090 [Acidobacteriota bacterium]|nr:hypothetical protein [Acidobacteriota bacterium]